MKRCGEMLVMLAVLALAGCYHATIETGLPPSSQTVEDNFADAWVYGLVPPKTVETAVNVVWKGNTLMTPIGGGVVIQPTRALETSRRLEDKDNLLLKLHKTERITIHKTQWWWD